MSPGKVVKVLPGAVAIFAVIKATTLYIAGAFPDLMGWVLFSGVVCWIAWAYATDRDMPSYGSMDYEGGKNQLARTIYLVVMVGLGLFAGIVM